MKNFYLYLVAFVSGMAVMAIELTASRLLAPYFGTSLFVWTNIIGIILIALTAGYYLGGKLSERQPTREMLMKIIFCASILLFIVPTVIPFLANRSFESLLTFQDGSLIIFMSSFLVTLAVFFLPIMLLGMVSPFIIKLSSLESQAMGETSGKIFAVSTFGSLIGTFIPVLLTIPAIGSRNTIYVFALSLLVLALLGLKRKSLTLFMIFPLVAFQSLTPVANSKTIYATESPYQSIRVEQSNSWRYIAINEGGGTQSVYRRSKIEFPGTYYDASAHVPSLVDKKVRKILLIGSAGGTLVRTWKQIYGDSVEITAVEIDPKMFEIARAYFGIKGDEARFVEADGRMFARTTQEKFDLIFIDAYANQFYVPFHLSTQEFFQTLKSKLEPGGLVALNLVASENSLLSKSFYRTLTSVFSDVRSAQANDSISFLVVSGESVEPMRLVELNFGPESLKAVARGIALGMKSVVADQTVKILRDDLAPVERMTESMFWAYYKEQSRRTYE